MKQNPHYLLIAALVLAGVVTVSCGKQLDEPQPQDSGRTVTLTSTIGLDAPTKALTALGEKTFAKDDQIAVIYKQNGGATAMALSNALTDSDIYDGGRKANITVTLDNLAENGAIRYIYPAGMALATVATDADVNSDAATIDFTQLDAQDGTLETLAANYDLSVFDGTLNGLELPASALLGNQLTIGEFTIKNWSGTAITTELTSFAVTDGTNTYTITPASPATNLTGPVYVAMLPVSDTQELSFTATDGTTYYTRTITGKTLAKNNMYPVNLKMFRLITVDSSTATFTLENGDAITGTGGASTSVNIADGATVTLCNVTLTNNSITCDGDATILLNGTNVVSGGKFGIWIKKIGDDLKTLTIEGPGSLTVSGDTGAGIGGRGLYDAGNIIINGGDITATSFGGGAGIGASRDGNCGSITINGGTVLASSHNSGAGIGSGSVNDLSRTCGDITITGGSITAISYYGAGIGTGCNAGDGLSLSCGNILISGGVVTAISGCDGAAIGSGQKYDVGASNECGTITIKNTVTSVSVAIWAYDGYNYEYIGAGNGATSGIVTIDSHTMTASEKLNPSTCNASDFPSFLWTGPESITNPYDPSDPFYNATKWTLTHK